MTDIDAASGNPRLTGSLVNLTHVIYALRAFAVVSGMPFQE